MSHGCEWHDGHLHALKVKTDQNGENVQKKWEYGHLHALKIKKRAKW